MKETNNLEKSLIIKKPEGIFSRFLNWAKGLFTRKNEKVWMPEEIQPAPVQEITIPKAVKMPVREIETEEQIENGLEYLYKLSDDELDDLSKDYDNQMEEAKNEFLKLENILQTYKQTIKKLQGKMEEENY